MKFLESERKDVLKVIEESGLKPEEFSFLKRKGRMHIQYPGQTDFVYFRRKSAYIVDGNRFERGNSYELEMAGQTLPMERWEDVREVFASWVSRIPV